MNEKKCIEFLNQLFFQSYMNENFFRDLLKIGVNFLTWPEVFHFEKAKKFFKIAVEKSYSSAMIELDFELPDSAYKQIISEEEVKIFYADYVNFLRALELTKKLKLNPENATVLCSNFLNQKTSTSKKINLADAVSEFVSENEKKISSENMNVVLSGFPCLSEVVGGFNKGRVTIVTAVTGFGKTNFGINFLKSAIEDKRKSLYINMEMDTVDMTKRFLQGWFRMVGFEFEKKDYIQKIQPAKDVVELAKNWITDGSSMSISEISQMTSEIKRVQDLDFLIVDYDQKIIMDDSGIKEEWQAVKKAVEMLEALAKKESVHVLMFAQTNDDNAGAPIASKRSMQPASAVLQFSRDSDKAYLKFIKNRFGPINKKIKVIYDPARSLIIEDGFVVEVLEQPQPPNRRSFYGN